MTGCAPWWARHCAPGTLGCEKKNTKGPYHNGMNVFASKSSAVTLFKSRCSVSNLSWRHGGKVCQLSSLIDLVCKGSEERIKGRNDRFLFHIHFKVHPFMLRVCCYWCSRGGVLVGEPFNCWMRNHLKEFRLERRAETPFPIEFPNFLIIQTKSAAHTYFLWKRPERAKKHQGGLGGDWRSILKL